MNQPPEPDNRQAEEAADSATWQALYQRLKSIAGAQLARESGANQLHPTMLVNEAWLRMADLKMSFQSREHFLAMAARVMRRVLVDQARASRAEKRDVRLRVTFNSALIGNDPDSDLLEVHEAIEALAKYDPRKAQATELCYFGGMTYDEIGRALDVSAATVKRELRMARAWLLTELQCGTASVDYE